MKIIGIEPTSVHQNCVVDALSRVGRIQAAEDFLQLEMKEHTLISLRTLLGACRVYVCYCVIPMQESIK